MFSSLKFRLTFIVCLIIAGIFACIPFLSSKIQETVMTTFNEQAVADSTKLYQRVISTVKAGAESDAKLFFEEVSNFVPLLSDPIDEGSWATSLNSIGGTLGAGYLATRIVSFDTDKNRVYDHKINENAQSFDASGKSVTEGLDKTLDSEMPTWYTVYSEVKKPFLALFYPGLDEDEELTHVHMIVFDLAVVQHTFKKESGSYAILDYNKMEIYYGTKPSYKEVKGEKYLQLDNKFYSIRTLPLKKEIYGAPANVRVYVDVTTIRAQIKNLEKQVYMAMAIAFGVIIPLLIIIIWFMLRRLKVALTAVAQLSEGDLTINVDVGNNDEVGQLLGAFNGMAANWRSLIKMITDSSSTLNKSATKLAEVSQDMETGAQTVNIQTKSAAQLSDEMAREMKRISEVTEQTNEQVQNLSAANEEISQTISNVANATDQVAGNASSVSNSIQGVSSTLNDITLNTNKADSVSGETTAMVEEARKVMAILEQSANNIFQVIEFIETTSNKINLLAVNSLIEAANAGKAGASFSVIAKEVKQLANNTGKATQETGDQIKEMHDNTIIMKETVEKITESVLNLNSINSEIATATAGQNKKTNEVAGTTNEMVGDMGNVSKDIENTALGAREVSQNAAKISGNVADVNQTIMGVTNNAVQVSSKVQQVNQSTENTLSQAQTLKSDSDGLIRISKELQDLVGKFNI